MISLSNCLRLPAAAFLGFANLILLFLLSVTKSSRVIKTSPLISIMFGGFKVLSFFGISIIVLILFVTTSPTSPFPLVTPSFKIPF